MTTDTGTYSVENGTGGFANVRDVPYIDIAATRSPDGRALTLFCVNRSLNFDQQTEIAVDAFKAARVAEVQQITAVSRYVVNDEVEPKRVIPQPSSLTVKSGEPLRISLPHESVTVIHLHAR